ncbi:MAG: roadblock/LC7 domain-containing protein [Anaerolineales bacterium]
MSEDRSQDNWDALFGVENRPQGAARPQAPGDQLAKYLQLPGVRGVVRLALDGVVLGQAGEIDGEQHGALSAFIGTSGGQLGQTLRMGALQYALFSLTGESKPFLVLRYREGYLGLLLEGEMSPTHVVARLQQTWGEG